MFDHRPFDRLGRTDLDWLQARHHFCFAHYQHAERMSWGRLRVVNHNRLAARKTVPPRYHHDMEMLMLVQKGELMIRTSLGKDHRLVPGELLLISAGTGIEYSIPGRGRGAVDYSEIWITPDVPNTEPAVAHRTLRPAYGPVTLASGRDADAETPLHADARISLTQMAAGEARSIPLRCTDLCYAVALSGRIETAGTALGARDGLAIEGEESLPVRGRGPAELLLIETA